jgi:hypothetical protein
VLHNQKAKLDELERNNQKSATDAIDKKMFFHFMSLKDLPQRHRDTEKTKLYGRRNENVAANSRCLYWPCSILSSLCLCVSVVKTSKSGDEAPHSKRKAVRT